MKRVVIIYNPVAGWMRRGRLKRLLVLLRKAGCSVVMRRTTAPGDATKFAVEATTGGGVDAVIVAGGDGTVNEVASGLVGTDVPLAVAPLGTANVLAHEIGIGNSVRRAAEAVLSNRTIDVMPGTVGGRLFVLMASFGVDACAVDAVDRRLKRATGKLAYAVSALSAIWKGRHQSWTAQWDGRTVSGGLILATRASRYAGAFLVAPEARLEEPMLHVIVIPSTGMGGFIRYGVAMALGRLHRADGVKIFSTDQIAFTQPEGQPVQADGDIVGAAPVRVGIYGKPVRILVPRSY